MRKRRSTWLWFMAGLGSQLQLIASLSMTELAALIGALVLLTRSLSGMNRDGVSTFWWLAVLTFVGCVVSCVANHTSFVYTLRGTAVTALIPCVIVCSYCLLRKDPAGFKWYLLGMAISRVLCTFVFRQAVEVTMLAAGNVGAHTSADIMAGPIFWLTRLSGFLTWPTKAFYLHTHTWFDIAAIVSIALVAALTTESGRSALLGVAGTCALLILGGKSAMHIRRRVCRHLGLIAVAAFLGIVGAHTFYRVAATSGWLGEKALVKYERQTQGDTSIKRLLIGGRAESFIGLLACFDRPIIGSGAWAFDTKGYAREFMFKYGTDEDAEMLTHMASEMSRLGIEEGIGWIPCHSCIVQFWCWYGIFGLFFWIYVIYAFIRYLKDDAWSVPQWYGWLACAIPGMIWMILFSSFADRVTTPLFITAILMTRAVRRGTFVLPIEMQREIMISNHEKR